MKCLFKSADLLWVALAFMSTRRESNGLSSRMFSDNESNEGRIFESTTADLGLYQLISEPTHVMGESKSCIDLIFTDQPNLIINSGVHPSLHNQCHHHIVYGKLSVSNMAPPSYTRRIWHYRKADFINIMKSIDMFNWHEQLG